MSNSQEIAKPDPTDLDAFLPWICIQLQLNFEIRIERVVQKDYNSALASERGKPPKSIPQVSTPSNPNFGSDHDKTSSTSGESTLNAVYVTFIVDHSDNLVSIDLNKNRKIPRELIKILAFIIPYHAHLTSVTISRGLNAHVIYELNKILTMSKITEICLDGCFLEEGNYYILLDNKSCLVNLSLSRCSMGDVVVGLIASKLVHPLPGSKLLCLNLSTNRISDVGARAIGVALRNNIKLAYLNLANNMITDDGADFILNSFLEFNLSTEEVLAARHRNVEHLKARDSLIADMVADLKSDLDKKGQKKRKPTATVLKKPKSLEREREGSLKMQSLGDLDGLYLEKAEAMALETLGAFEDPFSPDNIVAKDDMVFCKGNKSLCYLSLAYNNLTYPSAEKMLEVLKYQNSSRPKGLVNVCLEGNALPISSRAMTLIDEMLDSNLNMLCKRSINLAQKKKPGKGAKA